MQRILGLLAVVSLTVASQATAAIVLVDNGTAAYTQTGPSGSLIVYNDSTAAPLATVTAGTAPGATSSTTGTFSTVTGTLNGSYTQARPGNTQCAVGTVYADFKVTSNTPYTASGSYLNPTGGTVQFFSNLIDNTLGGISVYAYTETSNAPVITIHSGGPGFFGSLTGTLIANHDYYWDSYAELDSGASGSGSATLQIGTLAAVPEAQSFAVWSILAVALGGVAWYRRSSTAAVA